MLATSTTGTSASTSRRAMTSSVSVMPTFVSTTKTMMSAVSIAASACRAMAAWMPLTFGSHPPVSWTRKRWPFQSAR